MRLRIVTPARMVVDTEVSEVTAPGIVGEFGVLPEHVTFLGGLDVGVLTYVSKDGKRALFVDGGYAEVVNDVVTILADDALSPEEIDSTAARAEAARLEGELERGSDDPAVTARLLHRLKAARARIAAAA